MVKEKEEMNVKMNKYKVTLFSLKEELYEVRKDLHKVTKKKDSLIKTLSKVIKTSKTVTPLFSDTLKLVGSLFDEINLNNQQLCLVRANSFGSNQEQQNANYGMLLFSGEENVRNNMSQFGKRVREEIKRSRARCEHIKEDINVLTKAFQLIQSRVNSPSSPHIQSAPQKLPQQQSPQKQTQIKMRQEEKKRTEELKKKDEELRREEEELIKELRKQELLLQMEEAEQQQIKEEEKRITEREMKEQHVLSLLVGKKVPVASYYKLQEMGFVNYENMDYLASLLIKHNGNTTAVIDHIIAN